MRLAHSESSNSSKASRASQTSPMRSARSRILPGMPVEIAELTESMGIFLCLLDGRPHNVRPVDNRPATSAPDTASSPCPSPPCSWASIATRPYARASAWAGMRVDSMEAVPRGGGAPRVMASPSLIRPARLNSPSHSRVPPCASVLYVSASGPVVCMHLVYKPKHGNRESMAPSRTATGI